MTHESLPRDDYTDAEFRRIVTLLRRSTRLPQQLQATRSRIDGENHGGFDDWVLLPDAWERIEQTQ